LADPNPEVAAALADSEQMFTATFGVDWARTGYTHPLSDISSFVSDVTIDRGATGSLPIEAGLVEGYTSAQLTATIDGSLDIAVTTVSSGSGLFPAAALYPGTTLYPSGGAAPSGSEPLYMVESLAPYRPDSSLYHQPVLAAPAFTSIAIRTDSGYVDYTQMTGQVRSIRVDSNKRSATIVVSDYADVLRAPITLPTYGMDLAARIVNRHKFYVRSQALIDYVLRSNGIYSSPRAHPNVQLSCTGHGWLAAEVGSNSVPQGLADSIAGDAWWTDGPFNMLAVRAGVFSSTAAVQQFKALSPYTPAAGNGVGIAAWVRVGLNFAGTSGTSYNLVELFPQVDATYSLVMAFSDTGRLSGRVNGTGFFVATTTSLAWRYCALHFEHQTGGNTKITFRMDGVTSSGTITTPATTQPLAPFLGVNARMGVVDWSNLQVWFSAVAPTVWPGETHTPEASIDAGLNLMTHLPDVVNEDSWKVIQDVAAAEYGLVGFDETGFFSFKDRNHALVTQPWADTVTADLELQNLATISSADSIANRVTAQTTAGYQSFVNRIIVANDPAEFDSPPGTTVWAVPLAYSAIGDAVVTVPQISSALWDANGYNGYVAVRATAPATEVTSGVRVVFVPAGFRLGWVVVYNTSGVTVRLATTSNSAALHVQGWLLVPQPAALTSVSDATSITTYGQRNLDLPSNPYQQLVTPMTAVANQLLTELKNPKPVLDNITTNGNPRRSLGNTVTVVDPYTNGTITTRVVKITRRYNNGQLTDTLSVRPVSAP
jgi:hypothetical protein